MHCVYGLLRNAVVLNGLGSNRDSCDQFRSFFHELGLEDATNLRAKVLGKRGSFDEGGRAIGMQDLEGGNLFIDFSFFFFFFF